MMIRLTKEAKARLRRGQVFHPSIATSSAAAPDHEPVHAPPQNQQNTTLTNGSTSEHGVQHAAPSQTSTEHLGHLTPV